MVRNRHLIIFSSILGYLTLALGLIVVIGWYFKFPLLVQFSPSFVPMQFNTALSFIGLGCSLVVLNYRKKLLSCLVALIPLGFGLLTVVEYLYNVDLGIDQFLFRPFLEVNNPFPGRMAPNSALCFILLGISVILASILKTRLNKIWLSGALASLSFALGIVTFFGYILDVREAYSWFNMIHMSLPASLGFLLISLGIYLNVIDGVRKNIVRISVLFGILMTTFLIEVFVWHPLRTIYALDMSARFIVFFVCVGILLTIAFYLVRDVLRLSINLEEALYSAKESGKEKDVLLRHISHEIRNPLHAALGLLQLYSDEHKDDESIKRIYASCHHILHVVENLLTITRREGEGLTLENKAFNYGEWAESVEAICQVLATPHQIEFQFSIKGDKSRTLTGDSTKLSQIVFNFVDNAIKYTKQGAVMVELELQAQFKEGLLSIRVEDTGIGIHPENQQRVFQFFGRSSAEHRSMGAGYGLAICKAYTELMKGKIFFTSVRGQGSVFTVQVMLPLEQSQAA